MRRSLVILSLGAAALAAPARGRAQGGGLAARVESAAGAAVAFEFPSKPGVCGDGRSYIRVGPRSFIGSWNGERLDASTCQAGPVRVVLRRAAGATTGVRTTVGPVPSDGATELGTVPASEAASYLLDVAERGSGRVADDAIQPALLGEGVDASQRLLAIARGRSGMRGRARHEPLFWAGRYAAAKLRGRDTPFDAEEGCDAADDKRNAVFVLSQLHGGQAVPALIDVANDNRDGCVRGAALFWLVESGDDRALDVIASVLGSG